MHKHDIQHSADVKALIDAFYAKVQGDEVIGYFFEGVDWAHHLPKMYGFWAFLLLGGENTYQGNPIQKHFDLHAHKPLKAAHFDRWLSLFQSTVDELFEGENAKNAKFRAFAIAETWKPKFDGMFAV